MDVPRTTDAMRNGNSMTSAYPGGGKYVHPFRVLYPFVKKGGYFIPYKSGKADEEIAQARSARSEAER